MAQGRRQVVPADWLDECLVPRVSVNELQHDGYRWYLGDMGRTSISLSSSPPEITASLPIRVVREVVLPSIVV